MTCHYVTWVVHAPPEAASPNQLPLWKPKTLSRHPSATPRVPWHARSARHSAVYAATAPRSVSLPAIFFLLGEVIHWEFIKKKLHGSFPMQKGLGSVADGEVQPTQPEYENTMCLILLLVVCRKSLCGSFLRWLLPVVVLMDAHPSMTRLLSLDGYPPSQSSIRNSN